MDPVSAISTALTSIQTAADIAKLLKDANLSLKDAEWKLKLADMAGALADAKVQIVDIRQMVTEKDEVIAKLQQALALKGQLLPKDSAYWLTDEHGDTVDGPFCTRCFDVDRVTVRLVARTKERQMRCPECKSEFCSQSAYDYLRPDAKESRDNAAQAIKESLDKQVRRSF